MTVTKNPLPFSLDIKAEISGVGVTFSLNENLRVTDSDIPCFSFSHSHSFFEFFYTESGVCRYSVENTDFAVDECRLLLIHPEESHSQIFTQGEPFSQFNLRMCFSPLSDSPRNASAQKLLRHMEKCLCEKRIFVDRDRTLLFYFRQIYRIYTEKDDGYIVRLQLLCSLLLTEILSGEETSFPVFADEVSEHQGAESVKNQIQHFMWKYYLTDLTPSMLAGNLHMSVRQTNRILQKTYGMTFTELLKELRLREAEKRILLTKESITAISQNCGFRNYNYFATCFKKHFGISPRDYRLSGGAKQKVRKSIK